MSPPDGERTRRRASSASALVIARALLVATVVVAVGASIVLVLWLTGAFEDGPPLSRVKANTALAMLVIALVLIAQPRFPLARLALIVPLLLAGGSLLEHASGASLGLDELLAPDPAMFATTSPGRVSVQSSTAVLLLTLAVGGLPDAPRSRWLVLPAAVLAGTVAYVALIGQLYGVDELVSGLRAARPIAVPTSISLIVLVTVVLGTYDHGRYFRVLLGPTPGGIVMRRLLPLGLIALPALGYLRVLGEREEWWSADAGLALLMLVLAGIGAVAVLETARSLDRVDARAQQALAQAGAAATARADLLATVSHEVRTPLAAVLGSLELLAQGDVPEQQRPMLDAAQSGATAIYELVNDLLDHSKLDAGALVIDRGATDVEALLAEVAATFAAVAADQGVALSFTAADPPIGTLRLDAARVRQVVSNLVSNALQAAPGRAVTITGAARGGRLAITVRDTGRGMDPATLARIFEPFVQADDRSTKRDSTGLGLTISRQLADAMGGTLSATSVRGEGSAFVLTLPLERATAAREALPVEAAGPELPGARILVAEDDETMALVLSTLLERRGHRVHVEADGRTAADAVLAGTYDIAVFDGHLEGMDGLPAIERVRAGTGAGNATPIIVLTGSTLTDADRDAYVRAGAARVLIKPIRTTDLTAAIAAVRQSGGPAA